MSQISDLPNRDESPNSSSDLAQLSLRSSANPKSTPAPPINPLLPLSAHYTLLNHTLLPAFAQSFARQSYSIAYAAGVQFIEMALVGIPSHAYFDAETLANSEKNSPENQQDSSKNYSAKSTMGPCEHERQQSIQDAVRVAALLDEMVRTEKVGADACSDSGEARRLKRMADEAAARDDLNVQICGLGTAEAACAGWTGIVGGLGFDAANNGGRDDAAASPKPDRSTSMWDWAADHADNVCGRLVDEICSGTGRAPASTTAPDPDGNTREMPFQDANDTSDEQFQADMERALYLSGLDSARVDRIRDAQDEQEARRKRRKHRRMKAVGRPRPEHVHVNPKQEDEDVVWTHRQRSASDADDKAARSDSDGRDGPEVESSPSRSALSVPDEIRSQHARRLEALHALADNSRDDFHALRKANRIRVYPLSTFQGRVAGSVNGCTVIAPLIAIAHLRREEDGDKTKSDRKEKLIDADQDGMDWERTSATSSSDLPVDDEMFGVSDKVIEDIIDEDAPSILPAIRAKLNLSGSAFIIPSDVHDFLMDSALLEQEQFVGVSGGNIFDPGHLESFVSALSAEDFDRPIGATLFFHEHVVSLHRLVVKKGTGVSKTELWFDFIDSLPAKKMLHYDTEENDTNLSMEEDLAQGESRDAFEGLDVIKGTEDNGVRLRCADAESLLAMIRWYAYSKLTDKDRSYISRCAWNDSNTDFDPRVFQAFIWGGY